MLYSTHDDYLPELKMVIEAGADVNIKNEKGETALMHAAWRGSTNAAKILIDAGANINACSDEGQTALIYASGYGHSAIVQMLIDIGADVNHKK
jgi:ankyrin repeat protein